MAHALGELTEQGAPVYQNAQPVLNAGQGSHDAILNQLQSLIGNDDRKTARAAIDNANKRPALGGVAGVFGILVLAMYL